MKNLYKNILSVCLLMCFALSASAQVTQIWNNDGSLHKVKIDNDKLFVITSTGVYEQNLDESGNLSGNGFELSKLFDNFGYEVIDFIQNGDQIIVITNNNINQGETIFKSVDRGSTWVDVSNKFKESKSKMRLLQSDYDKEAFYAQVGSTLYYSSDFGETFECTTSIHSDIFDCSKFDSKVLVYSTEYLYIEEYHYIISHDSGQTQSTSVDNFMITHDIAFHYSDPNKILLIGNKIVLSEDGGKTWQHLTYSKNELDCIDRKFKFEFSKSGSDRLYITDNNLLYYSDDYGVTWNELYELDLEEGDKIDDFLQHGKMIYSYTSSGKIYQMNFEELEAIEEPSDYEYTPLVREGVVWEYFHNGWTSEFEYYSRIYIAGEENINNTIYHKCYIVNPYSKNECIAYVREEDKKVYLLSLDENVTFQYNTNGQEILIYDFNLNEGDSYSIEIEGNVYDMNVVKVEYKNVDGELCKTFEIYNKEINDYYTITEGIGVVGELDGFFCFPYAPMLTGKGNPIYIRQEVHEYTPLVEDGKVWNYFENWGWEVIEDDYARIAMSGQEEINGKIYTKCWFYYGHCEFSEENAMLLCYMREEDKRVYMLPAIDYSRCPAFFMGYASEMEEAQEYLLYDFNLSAGDSYHEFPYYEDDWLNHTIESVEFIEIDGKLRKKYVLSNSHNVIEGIGIIGDFSGYVCSPNPVLPTCSYSTPRLSHISTLDGETTLVYFGGDPCLISEDEYQYEYVPVVREDVVWGYYSNTNASEGGKTTYIRFDGEEVINGKTYLKCYRSDDCSFDENKSELLGYMREEDKRVYAIVPQGDVLPEESLRYDFNLSAGDSFTRVGGNTVTISRVNNVVINGKLRKCYYYNQDATESGSCYTEGIGQWLYGDIISTDSNYRFVMEKNINTGEVFDHSRGITTLNPCDKLSVDQITENSLSFVQADDRISIIGATGKVNVAIYTFDGVKVAEASGSESVSLSTAELPIGIYVVKATDSTGNKLIQKIVIK